MGKVFLCEHLLLQRLVAVKVLATAGVAAPAAGVVERFYREARAVAALDSAHVVEVYDVDAARGQPFMVMEYVDGADLHRVTNASGRLPVAAAADYARQAALGLCDAHAAGLVHRDIKPGNVLVDRSGAVKLLDFGLALFFADASRNQNLTARFDGEGILGTADFISPEQITNSSGVDIRSDLYSLGCTLYFFLAGRMVFDEGTAAQKLIWHQFSEPVGLSAYRSDVPEGLEARGVGGGRPPTARQKAGRPVPDAGRGGGSPDPVRRRWAVPATGGGAAEDGAGLVPARPFSNAAADWLWAVGSRLGRGRATNTSPGRGAVLDRPGRPAPNPPANAASGGAAVHSAVVICFVAGCSTTTDGRARCGGDGGRHRSARRGRAVAAGRRAGRGNLTRVRALARDPRSEGGWVHVRRADDGAVGGAVRGEDRG
ncbi:serine/threonine protein kinase [bacterium]|nr:serine/threonine protein kinase [bacterium]